MAAEQSPRKDSAESTAPTTNRGPGARAGRVSSGLALILALVAVSATGYLWYMLLYRQQDLLALDVPNALARLETANATIEKSLASTNERLDTLAETNDTLTAAIDTLQNEFGRTRVNWILGETEQLLLIANRRLQLARDVSTALTTLRAADRQIELLAQPNLLPVRRQLAREISALEALDKTDLAGLSIRITTLADSIDHLPLTQALHRPATADNGPVLDPDRGTEDGPNTARGLWRDMLGLVQIRRHDTADLSLLPPEQQYFLRENLRLVLYSAQHALLQGHIAVYRRNLDTAAAWVRTRFDETASSVRAAREELERLQAAPVTLDLPNISGSLTLLRQLAGRESAS